MSFLLGDVIYFDAFGNNGTELWAYNTSNNTGWMVSDINNGSHSNPGEHLSVLVGDTIYFSADDGSYGVELWAHNTSNGTTWQVADIWSGADSGLTSSINLHQQTPCAPHRRHHLLRCERWKRRSRSCGRTTPPI